MWVIWNARVYIPGMIYLMTSAEATPLKTTVEMEDFKYIHRHVGSSLCSTQYSFMEPATGFGN